MTFFNPDQRLAEVGDRLLSVTREQFPTLARDQIAITWLVYDTPIRDLTAAVPPAANSSANPKTTPGQRIRGYSYRGDELIYPASIVKLFYLVAVHQWFAQGKLYPTAELQRAVRDMIVDSSNDATALVIDMLTHTTGGPEMPADEFEAWKDKRNQINRYIQSLGWPDLKAINANQKTWCDGPYGRERAFVGTNLENRNQLTTNASARLLHNIVAGQLVSAQACQDMMALMARSIAPADLAADPENQVTGFLGAGLPQTAKLWSKAGLTSKVRHDAAYIELPDVHPYVLVVFTEGKAHSNNEAILPFVAQQTVQHVANFKD